MVTSGYLVTNDVTTTPLSYPLNQLRSRMEAGAVSGAIAQLGGTAQITKTCSTGPIDPAPRAQYGEQQTVAMTLRRTLHALPAGSPAPRRGGPCTCRQLALGPLVPR
jgi:hypothetical protein